MLFYCRTEKPHPKRLAFETGAAIEVGGAVRTEARNYRPGAGARSRIPGASVLRVQVRSVTGRQFELFFLAASAATFS